MSGRNPILVLALLFGFLPAGAVCPESGGESPLQNRLNVCLITIDTLRADHVGCYGYAEAVSPNIDALARTGFLFTNAVTPAPLTGPAHASLLTGVLPPVHGLRDNFKRAIAPGCPTLAEIFRQGGYETGAAVGSFVLDHRFGFARGFGDLFDDVFPGAERKAPAVSEAGFALLSKLDREGAPFFLWLHYYDAHAPYDPLPEFRSKFPESPYDGEIAGVDREVGRIVYRLKKAGLFERTILVIVGDHGEGLGDHGEAEHGSELYDTTVRVPLLFSLPGHRKRNVQLDGQVSLVDIMPTLLDLTGIPNQAKIQGHSFAPLLSGGKGVRLSSVGYVEAYRDAYIPGGRPVFGIREGGYKYIEKEPPQLYNLSGDPHESENVYAKEPARGRKLARKLRALAAECKARSRPPGEEPALGQEEVRKIKSLGYMK
jgi:choline-sulfatase